MKKKFFSIKPASIGVGCMICALALTSLTGCHKKAGSTRTIEYSKIMGIAEGTADFKSVDSPEINIKEIQSYVGQEIDYSSGIDVENIDNIDDFQMWVDATKVDIYTVGRYTATYQFVVGEKTFEKTVGVTVMEKEESGGDSSLADNSQNEGGSSEQNNGNIGEFSNGGSLGGNGDNISNGDTPNSGSSGGNGDNISNGNTPNGGSLGGNGDNISNGDTPNSGSLGGNGNNTPNGGSSGGNNENTPNGNTSNGGSSGGNNPGSPNGGSSGGDSSGDVPNGGSSNGNEGEPSSESREIITSSQSATKKPSTIGYTNIELLSGRYVKLKCTNAKYIVSTRTDESQTVKNDKTYNVSKLVITFNTGEERVLETVEKAVS